VIIKRSKVQMGEKIAAIVFAAYLFGAPASSGYFYHHSCKDEKDARAFCTFIALPVWPIALTVSLSIRAFE
jgi:hypothetical protein